MRKNSLVPVTRAATEPTGTVLTGWAGLGSLRDEIDRIFESFGEPRGWFGRSFADLMPEAAQLIPALDLVEKDTGYEIVAELPGLGPDDVELKVSDGVLSLRGEKTENRDEDITGFHFRERRWGSFLRQVRLPVNIDEEKIEASVSKGVLTVRLPKSATALAAAKTIEVKPA